MQGTEIGNICAAFTVESCTNPVQGPWFPICVAFCNPNRNGYLLLYKNHLSSLYNIWNAVGFVCSGSIADL